MARAWVGDFRVKWGSTANCSVAAKPSEVFTRTAPFQNSNTASTRGAAGQNTAPCLHTRPLKMFECVLRRYGSGGPRLQKRWSTKDPGAVPTEPGDERRVVRETSTADANRLA